MNRFLDNDFPKKKVIYLVTEDWYFCSHRLPIARAVRDAGCEVIVVTRVNKHGDAILQEGFRLIPLRMSRRSKNPIRELFAILEIINVYHREQPDLVHHVALKPVLYGTLAARITGVHAIINALAGLGYVFSSDQKRAKLIKLFVRLAFRSLMNFSNGRVLLQNPDDQQLLIESKIVLPENTALIRGSGVNLQRFVPLPEPAQAPIVVTLVARMLRDKGILQFVEAAKTLKQQGISIRAVLVGTPDPENPTSIQDDQLKSWQSEGWVEWWGEVRDIPGVWAQSHIAVLPSSYGEGVPMSLIEAAACARPIITTNMPGCREIVRHEETGILVPVMNHNALVDAIIRLSKNPGLRKQMGENGRKLVEKEFAEAIVVEQTLGLYRSVIEK